MFTGNGGADTFVFATNFGHASITNFQAKGSSHDVVQFSTSTFNSFAAMVAHAAQVGADTVITDANHDTLTLKNVKLWTLHSVDFQFT